MGINCSGRIATPIQLFSSSHFLKLVTKILLPFSVLSVILSYPLLCNFHFLTYGLQLFSFSVGKNYMFLLCNGLLVFIATSSGLIGSFPVETDFKVEKTLKSKGGSQRELQVGSSEQKGSIATAKVIPEVDQEAQGSKMDSLALLVQGREDVPLIVQDEGEEQRHELVSVEQDEDEGLGLMSNEELNKKCEDVPLIVQDEGEEQRHELVSVEQDEDEGLGLMSNEELNKKCEDFIRKIKEGIKYEALQLITVQ
ncbi:hypothetical protein CRYUN_Cryun01aG0130000 [Craigia yunnanensis]